MIHIARAIACCGFLAFAAFLLTKGYPIACVLVVIFGAMGAAMSGND